MHKFKTGTTEWDIDFNIGSLMRLQKEAQLDFLRDPTEGGLADRLATDIQFLYDTIWHIVSPQAAAAGVTAEQFGGMMDPADLIGARTVLFAAWAEFFQRLQKGPASIAVSKAILFQETVEETSRRAVENSEPLAQMTERFAASLEKRLDREFAKLPAAFEKAMAELDADEPTVDVKVITPAA